MRQYLKQYHIVKYSLVGLALWLLLAGYGSFTVGRVHTHQVQVQKQETQIKAQQKAAKQRKQAEMKRQVLKLQARVNDLQSQATAYNQRTKHVILPSEADEKLKAKIGKQVNQLAPKIADLDTQVAGVRSLRQSYHRLQQATAGYGY